MPANVNRTEFCFWVEQMYMHLETFEGWKGIQYLLKEVRQLQQDVDDSSLNDCMIRAETASRFEFNKSLFDEKDKDRELYLYLY